LRSSYYLAYGSNLHPHRLRERGLQPRFVGIAELSGHELAFHKRSVDGSAKCTLYRTPGMRAFGAVYSLSPAEQAALDDIEGPGYAAGEITVQTNGDQLTAVTYFANESYLELSLTPYDWYRALVLAGCRYHGFPADYIAGIEQVAVIPDPHAERSRLNARLVEALTPMDNPARSRRRA